MKGTAMTLFEAIFVFVIVWGSLFLFLWLRGIIHDRRKKKSVK
jgi:hypothetical protein